MGIIQRALFCKNGEKCVTTQEEDNFVRDNFTFKESVIHKN